MELWKAKLFVQGFRENFKTPLAYDKFNAQLQSNKLPIRIAAILQFCIFSTEVTLASIWNNENLTWDVYMKISAEFGIPLHKMWNLLKLLYELPESED